MKLKDVIDEEKPREKLRRLGPKGLSDSELLSIILRTGNKDESVNELSNKILKEIGGVKGLKEMTLNSLMKVKGIKLSKASIIIASFELAKRGSFAYTKVKFRNVEDMYNYVKLDYIDFTQEKFIILLFDIKMRLILKKELFIGTINEINISPREIFKEALKENASFVVLCHNHPSGDVTPSMQDNETTDKLIEIGKMMQVRVIDHLIIGSDSYFSYYENMQNNKFNE